MTTTKTRGLYWAPRALGLGVAGFLSIFAADVLGKGGTVWETALALILHLIPTWIVLASLAVAWRWEPAGALLFVGLGLLSIVSAWGLFPFIAYLAISGPLLVTGALFFLNWSIRARPDGRVAAP